jgi:hypothetical protein
LIGISIFNGGWSKKSTRTNNVSGRYKFDYEHFHKGEKYCHLERWTNSQRFQGNGTEAYVPIQLNPFEDVTELIHKVRNTTPPSREVKHPIDKRVWCHSLNFFLCWRAERSCNFSCWIFSYYILKRCCCCFSVATPCVCVCVLCVVAWSHLCLVLLVCVPAFVIPLY